MVQYKIEKVECNSIQRISDSNQLAPFLGDNYYYQFIMHLSGNMYSYK